MKYLLECFVENARLEDFVGGFTTIMENILGLENSVLSGKILLLKLQVIGIIR